jgi:hypothetical protein
MYDEQTLLRKIASRRQEVRNLQVLALRPGHSPEKLEFLRNLERSARAEVKLWRLALAHHLSQQSPPKP